jgi:hypothetical protein
MATIPAVIMHAGQQMYFFDGFQGDLVKYSCMYCGGGDYVLSGMPQPITAIELPETIAVVFTQVDITPTPVPEPGTGVMLLWVFMLACAINAYRIMRLGR